MKKHPSSLITYHLSPIAILLLSCSKEDSATQSATPYGDLAVPAWAVDSTYNLDRSMTAVVTVAQLGVPYTSVIVPVAVDSADLIATFCGDHCLSLAHPDPLGRFFLFIQAPSEAHRPLTLRYYSNHYRNIFLAQDSIVFNNGSQLGTASSPLAMQFSLMQM